MFFNMTFNMIRITFTRYLEKNVKAFARRQRRREKVKDEDEVNRNVIMDHIGDLIFN